MTEMVLSASAKILVGISSNPVESKELICWAIRVLASQNHSIVAVHCLEDKKRKKRESAIENQSRLRRGKAYVISVLGEFATASHSKQALEHLRLAIRCLRVYLEARVVFSSSVGKGLIEEAESISADFLLLGSSRNRSNRNRTSSVTRYCFENSPPCCTLVVVGKNGQLQQNPDLDSPPSKDSKLSVVQRREQASQRTVFDELGLGSTSTEDENNSSEDSSLIESPPMAWKLKDQSNVRRHRLSPCKLISSFLGSPFRKISCSFSNREMEQPLLRCFSYDEILKATNNFHPDNMVGQGGYSDVYRGKFSDGLLVAVKRLAKDNKDADKEKEFLVELGIIGHVLHPNTASLVGCCIENGLYLIFNFSENGNLASALHEISIKVLEWPERFKIIVGIAKGLQYLHKGCKHRIIHRDIKASNIILGLDYEPRITDFGLAKWLPNKWTHHAVIPIEGTFGYLAPEYFMHGIVDEKTDVFSFGVLLLEIVTARKPVDSSNQSLLLWAKPLMELGDIAKLADPKMRGKYDDKQIHRVVEAASRCVRQSSIRRPSMNEVLELLTSGNGSELRQSWRFPEFSSDGLDDYSMLFGYQVPSDILKEDYL